MSWNYPVQWNSSDLTLTEIIAAHVAIRFQQPPRVLVISREIDFHMAPHALRIRVMVETHFDSNIIGDLIHGWQGGDPDIGGVLASVDASIDVALGMQPLAQQQMDQFTEDYPDIVDWFKQFSGGYKEFEGLFPYTPPDWFGVDSPDFEGEEDDDS